jgi:hypothetical protein
LKFVNPVTGRTLGAFEGTKNKMDVRANEKDRVWFCLQSAMARAALSGRNSLSFAEIMAADPQFQWSTSISDRERERILGTSASSSPSVSASAAAARTETADTVKAELQAKHPGISFIEIRGGQS